MSFLITVEGLDGVGKSTLIAGLYNAVKDDPSFSEILMSKEPGSPWTSSGTELRHLALAAADFVPFERELLFYADASTHKRFLEAKQNAIVISDRGLWSHLAYLRGHLKVKQMDYADYDICQQIIRRSCAEPECVVYLRGDIQLMKERLKNKHKDIIEQNGDEFFSHVLETYEDLVVQHEWDGKPLVILDACDTIDTNIMKVINYLKEVFHCDQLRTGNKELCGI